jgi:hypothetical protein
MPRISDMVRRPITPSSGLWDALDPETQAWLDEIACNVKILLRRTRADDAWDELSSYRLEPENHAALWTRFESGERRVLTAVAEARRAKQ